MTWIFDLPMSNSLAGVQRGLGSDHSGGLRQAGAVDAGTNQGGD